MPRGWNEDIAPNDQTADRLPLAVSTGSVWPVPTVECLRALQECGVRDVELTLDHHEFVLAFDQTLRMPIWEEVRAMVAAQDLRVRSMHAVNMGTEHGYSLRMRAAYLSQMLQTCHQLGGQLVVVHPFHLCTTYEATLAYLRGELSSVHQILLPDVPTILEDARKAQIVVAVENVKVWQQDATDFFNAPRNVARFLEDVAHPNLQVTLDLVHAYLIGCQEEFLDRLGPHIVNLHVADVEPPARRVPVGEGVLDWDTFLPKMRALPGLQQMTDELAGATVRDTVRSVQFLRHGWKRAKMGVSAFLP